MNILILGGTGAIGIPLGKQLAKEDNVYVTTRNNTPPSQLSEIQQINYLIGNAKDTVFLSSILSKCHWDTIVDFMIWGKEFEQIVPLILNATEQYIFISSARVYAQSEEPIVEDTPRLLDVCENEEYLKTNEYALAKAREENFLFKSNRKNYTIVRPTITYNKYRLQLGVLEKENWLYRALHGRSIVFSNDIAGKLTTMTYGDDVAKGIASLVGKEEARGDVFHITYPQSLLWKDVLEIYLNELERYLGYRPKVVMGNHSTNLQFEDKKYQVIYCRVFNRTFDNSKIARFCEICDFESPEEGLTSCLKQFLGEPKFGTIDWRIEAVNDREAGELTPLNEIVGFSNKLTYIAYRYQLNILLLPYRVAGLARKMITLLCKT